MNIPLDHLNNVCYQMKEGPQANKNTGSNNFKLKKIKKNKSLGREYDAFVCMR